MRILRRRRPAGVFNLRLEYVWNDFEFTFMVDNLFDDTYVGSAVLPWMASFADDRNFRFGARYNF